MFKLYLDNCDIDKIPTISKIIVDVMKKEDIKACFFSGRVGIGKTALIKSISKLIGVQNIVTSPSFNIINEYKTVNGTAVYHFDFYRIANIAEALDLGVLEYLDNKKAYRFIEWSENVTKLLISRYILVVIDGDNYNKRNYKIEEVINEI